MKQFEYQVRDIRYTEIDSTLKISGENGWELIQLLEWGVGMCRLIMKREIEQQSGFPLDVMTETKPEHLTRIAGQKRR